MISPGESLVSIVVNNHNYAQFLPAAIDSALAQSYPRTEVVVVDDGSTDDSREVIARYGDRVIAVLKANGGQASALNAGFDRCSGEIVIFLDADDILLPQTAARVVSTFAADPSLAKVQYRMAVVDAAGRAIGEIKPAPHLRLCEGDLRREVLTFPDDLTWMATSGNAFPAAVLRRIFPIPEADYGRILADYYLSHVTPLFGPVRFLREIGALYRVHGANNHERTGRVLDLDQIRQTITYSRITHRHIRRFAAELALPGRPRREDELVGTSHAASRLASRRLDPSRHPVPGDTNLRLLLLGLVAARRRFDLPPALRALFAAWFLAAAFAPRPAARLLARLFFLPETRSSFNRALGRLRGLPSGRGGANAGGSGPGTAVTGNRDS